MLLEEGFKVQPEPLHSSRTIDMIFRIKGIVLPGELQAGEHIFCCLPLLVGWARATGSWLRFFYCCQQSIPLTLSKDSSIPSISTLFENLTPFPGSVQGMIGVVRLCANSGPNELKIVQEPQNPHPGHHHRYRRLINMAVTGYQASLEIVFRYQQANMNRRQHHAHIA